MISPSVRPEVWAVCVGARPISANAEACSLASAAEPTNAARPVAIAVLIQFLVMPFTPCLKTDRYFDPVE
ncbi:hypothetical protein GOC91_06175 [Sinorhizobium medicae]|uniref:Uncharacterized protein n=3 Tax=Sinorhizobium medicae TaxID=110321 RepID=A0A6G1WK16_9HYPH|nr:conserved hypothetical protein [Sinorhizobium medicae WSM419]MDX0404907.1 hypothetical protein [Sinorhizobium medicae]MDX0411900.1 hypothetical protein [Sinorhizobium medicae]MDX0416783.1 hypothetical protein [Sinorhizobium medicae]MDX0424126.1 hypothetical protein [Sinorhizobium medicae]